MGDFSAGATLDTGWALEWVRLSALAVAEHRVELSELDREIGDGDHGENLARGFNAVSAKMADAPAPDTVGDVLKLVATTLISTVGGAAGPLYGTAYLRAAKACDSAELDGPGVAALLAAGLEGIVARGKATTGEKTMVDAWSPAVEASRAAAEAGVSATDVLTAAAEAARQGSDDTIPLVATKGRASYLGERSAGHRDPGAASSALLIHAAVEAATGEHSAPTEAVGQA